MGYIKKKQIHIVFELTPNLLMDSYPGPLGQVISNLVQNAMVHAYEGRAGGTITLRVHPAEDPLQVRIEVQDDGRGMREEVVAHLFQAFFTTRQGVGGSGIGLTFSKRLIEKVLGGEIRAESKSGEGSRFMIDLPIVTPIFPETSGCAVPLKLTY